MEKVFQEVGTLDRRCYEQFELSEDILMEHAASSMFDIIQNRFEQNGSVLIVAGVGNNGADGIALARLLEKKFDVTLFLPFGTKSDMGKLQLRRASNIGCEPSISYEILLKKYDVVVDCLFGSGLSRELDESSQKIIDIVNKIEGFKIACDIPSGIDINGNIKNNCFNAQLTITMGALKRSLFTDEVKDFIGNIVVSDLGVQRELYEIDSDTYLLNYDDMNLPFRNTQNTHKGTFGHLAVIAGSKAGASILCAKAGFVFGAGLVSVCDHQNITLPSHIMQTHKLPHNTTAIAIGMGLGNYDKKEISQILENDIPKIIDADLFYEVEILKVLNKSNIVLTPHPKEFVSLLSICGIANIDIKELQNNRFKYLEIFCTKYPNIVLLLKGANVLIGYDDNIYINSYGNSKLSFGGSGDVLGGLIGSLLAQGYSTLDAVVTASLAHTKSASLFEHNNYAMTPDDLIEGIKKI
ncbi:MAG: NAD(P)H-hydrate dehydratase [Campylobacterota bacterium]|nr:NAD(P)H-hydrate dehydratase [Campylobacterota bacterium]